MRAPAQNGVDMPQDYAVENRPRTWLGLALAGPAEGKL